MMARPSWTKQQQLQIVTQAGRVAAPSYLVARPKSPCLMTKLIISYLNVNKKKLACLFLDFTLSGIPLPPDSFKVL